MTTPSIYINLEDDVSKIVARLKREKSGQVVLVCPKRCLLFSDSINLRLLKKQVDLMKKEVFILTMDEKGQRYAEEAGFRLRYLPKARRQGAVSDIAVRKPVSQSHNNWEEETPEGAKEPKQQPTLVQKLKKHITQPAPKVAEHTQVIPSVSINDNIFPDESVMARMQGSPVPEKKIGRIIVGLVAISLIVILVVGLVVLPKAEILVHAKTEPLSRDFEVTFLSGVNSSDVDRLQIPAQKVVMTLDSQSQFQSQGKKPVGSKAEGSVYIFNFTSQPINLKSSTTSFNVGSKSYVMLQDLIQVKPTKYKPGTKEIDMASVGEPVKIQATQGGDEYNLPTDTRIEISNKVFGSRPQVLYAKTAESLTGGNSRYISVVTDQDVNNSQARLSQNLIGEVRQGLAETGLVMPDGAYAVETQEFAADKPVGTESPVFNATLKGKVTGLAFSENDLKSLVNSRLKQNISTEKPVDIKTNALTFKLKSAPDFGSGSGVLQVHFEGKAAFRTSIDSIPAEVAGKGKDKINDYVKAHPEIDHVDVTLAPSWQTTFPYFKNKIHVISAN